MSRGIIYIMTTAVPGLIKIGKTGSANFEQRMYNLEHDGYRNVTALRRSFTIEVEDYDEKEAMLHTIFEKSRVADTELFALDINIVTQLLSSFDGVVVFPKTETKAEVFDAAVDNATGKLLPDGRYTFRRRKKSDNRVVRAAAVIDHGRWTLLKGSVLGVTENIGVSQKARAFRLNMQIDSGGVLLEDTELGACSPSFAGVIVMNQSTNGWITWKDKDGNSVEKYKKKSEDQ